MTKLEKVVGILINDRGRLETLLMDKVCPSHFGYKDCKRTAMSECPYYDGTYCEGCWNQEVAE
jgi:hypothetical protein